MLSTFSHPHLNTCPLCRTAFEAIPTFEAGLTSWEAYRVLTQYGLELDGNAHAVRLLEQHGWLELRAHSRIDRDPDLVFIGEPFDLIAAVAKVIGVKPW